MIQNRNLASILLELLEPVLKAVGGDVKKLNGLIASQTEEINRVRGLIPSDSVTMTQVEEKISELRMRLFGGDLDEAYDTFKELADKLKELDGSVGQAITEKLTELRNEIDALKSTGGTDYLAIYKEAKGEA